MENQRWFGALVRHRREELGLSPIQLQRIGGPSMETLAKIESGEGTLKHTTLVRIDQSLGWPEGASLRILSCTDNAAPPEIHWGRTLTATGTNPEAISHGLDGDAVDADPPGGKEVPAAKDPADRAGLIRVRVDFEAFFAAIGIEGVVEEEKALIGWEIAALDEQLAILHVGSVDQKRDEHVRALHRRRQELAAERTKVEERYLRDVAAYANAYAAAAEAEARRLGMTGPVIVECVGTGTTERGGGAGGDLVERLRRHARMTTPLPGSSYSTAQVYPEMEGSAVHDYRIRLRRSRRKNLFAAFEGVMGDSDRS